MPDLPERRELDKVMMKEAWKDAMKEWLDERYAQVGRWSIGVILMTALGALLYFILSVNGWHK